MAPPWKVIIVATLACCGALYPFPGAADTITATDPPEVTAAKNQAAIATAEADVAKAQADIYKAKIGSLTADLVPKGTIEAKSLGIEGQIRGYATVATAVQKIVASVSVRTAALKLKSVMLYSDAEWQAVVRERSFVATSAVLLAKAGEFDKRPGAVTLPGECVPGVKMAANALIPGGPVLDVVSAGLGLFGLFKTDRTLEGSAFSVDGFALNTLLLHEFSRTAHGPTVIYSPAAFIFKSADMSRDLAAPSKYRSTVLQSYSDLIDESEALNQVGVKYDDAKKQLTAATKNAKPACKEALSVKIDNIEQTATRAKWFQTVLQDVLAGATKTDGDTGRSVLTTYILAEQLDRAAAGAGILQVKVVAAGGTTETKKGVFASNIYFSGGSIVSYLLLDNEGNPIEADTLRVYAPFVALKDLSGTQ